MRNRCINIALSLMMGSLAHYGFAFAHGTEKHGKTVPADSQMMKLHAMMPMFSQASAKLETSLEKGEVAAVEAEAGKITTAISDLKKSKPHKNIKQRKKYVELAVELEETVTTTVNLAKKGDLAGAKTAFKKVEEVCAACHAKFRD
jgi:soluble cytochrome b562